MPSFLASKYCPAFFSEQVLPSFFERASIAQLFSEQALSKYRTCDVQNKYFQVSYTQQFSLAGPVARPAGLLIADLYDV